jgi:Holliday junction resolvase RusA-like endonuclease
MGVRFTPPRVREAQKEHKEACSYAIGVLGEPWPMKGRYALAVSAHYANRAALGDVDNVGKLVLDGLQGVAYDNDRDVVRVTFERHVGAEEPRTEVKIWWEP